MEDNHDDGAGDLPDSLLPYNAWAEDALRQVAVRALQYAAENGLPGAHHFYITFRTDQPGVSIPARLLAQYPHEITIVLQNKYWDLRVDEAAGYFTVGLSFGGVPSTLSVPFAAITAFTDPEVRFGLRFTVPELPAPEPEPEPAAEEPGEGAAPQVVSLDAFRRRTPPPK